MRAAEVAIAPARTIEPRMMRRATRQRRMEVVREASEVGERMAFAPEGLERVFHGSGLLARGPVTDVRGAPFPAGWRERGRVRGRGGSGPLRARRTSAHRPP